MYWCGEACRTSPKIVNYPTTLLTHQLAEYLKSTYLRFSKQTQRPLTCPDSNITQPSAPISHPNTLPSWLPICTLWRQCLFWWLSEILLHCWIWINYRSNILKVMFKGQCLLIFGSGVALHVSLWLQLGLLLIRGGLLFFISIGFTCMCACAQLIWGSFQRLCGHTN